jgi:excisionase family DNA binding protein
VNESSYFASPIDVTRLAIENLAVHATVKVEFLFTMELVRDGVGDRWSCNGYRSEVTRGVVAMNVREASLRLGVSRALVYQLCQEGQLGHARIGGRGRRGKIVVREEDIERFLHSVQVAPDASALKAGR